MKSAKNGDTVTLKGNITKNIVINKLINLDLNGKKITGNVTINTPAKGTINLKNGSIDGNLTVEAPQATVNNELTVTGDININNVAYGTWNEKANGNKLVVNDPDGIKLTVATGKTVATITVAPEAVGDVTITNNGTIEKVDAQASVELVNNAGAKTNLVTGNAPVEVKGEGTVVDNNNTTDPEFIALQDAQAAVKAYEDAPINNLEDVEAIAALRSIAESKVEELRASEKKNQLIERIFMKNAAVTFAKIKLTAEIAIESLPSFDDLRITHKANVLKAQELVSKVKELDSTAEVEGEGKISVYLNKIEYLEKEAANNYFSVNPVFTKAPAPLAILNTSTVEFKGYVKADQVKYIDKILIGGMQADVKLVGSNYEFSITLDNLEDDEQKIRFEVISQSGKSFDFLRRFYVDTTPPALELSVNGESNNVVTENDEIEIEINMADRFGHFDLYRSISESYLEDEYIDGGSGNYNTPLNKKITDTVKLEDGVNTFYYSLFDGVGNVTTKEITITRTAVEIAPVITMDKETLEVTAQVAIPNNQGAIGTDFNTELGELINVSLKKGTVDYSNVRIVVEGGEAGVQLIARDTTGNWYDIIQTGWGTPEGFPIADATTPVYVVANKAGTYTITIKLVDVSNNNKVLTSLTGTVNALSGNTTE